MAIEAFDMRLEDIVGLHVVRAWIAVVDEGDEYTSPDEILVLETTTGVVHLTPEGDCCARAYLEAVAGAEALTDATITEVEDLECTREERGDSDVLDTWGHRIHTTRGICTLDLRTSHNGWYSGSLSARPGALPEDATVLEDFS